MRKGPFRQGTGQLGTREMVVRGSSWTDASTARLRELWNEGLSTADIGQRLNLSKNAVIGKAHRLDLPSRPSPIRRVTDGARWPLHQPRRLPRAAKAAYARTSSTLPKLLCLQKATCLSALVHDRLLAQESTPPSWPQALSSPSAIKHEVQHRRSQPCSWPIGDPGKPGFRFCDAPAVPGKPYCLEHAERAYVRVKRGKTA